MCVCLYARGCMRERELNWGDFIKSSTDYCCSAQTHPSTMLTSKVGLISCLLWISAKTYVQNRIFKSVNINGESLGSQEICILLITRFIHTQVTNVSFYIHEYLLELCQHLTFHLLSRALPLAFTQPRSHTLPPLLPPLLLPSAATLSLFWSARGNHQLRMRVQTHVQLNGLHFHWI